MNVRYLFFLCPLIIFGCSQDDEPEPDISTLIELETPIYEERLFSEQDELYLITYFKKGNNYVTQGYLYDLKISTSQLLFEVPGGSGKTAISDDRTLIAVSTHISNSTGFEERITLIDLVEQTSEVLRSSESNILQASAFAKDNRYLLYNKYDGSNRIWRFDLTTKEDILISGEENAVYVSTSDVIDAVLVDTYFGFYFMDLDGKIINDVVERLSPKFLYDEGRKVLCQAPSEQYMHDGELYVYDVITEKVTLLADMGTILNPRDISNDGNTLLISTDKDHLDDEGHPTYSYEIYTLNVSSKELRRYTNNLIQEFPIGFYDNDLKILFSSNKKEGKAVYSLNL